MKNETTLEAGKIKTGYKLHTDNAVTSRINNIISQVKRDIAILAAVSAIIGITIFIVGYVANYLAIGSTQTPAPVGAAAGIAIGIGIDLGVALGLFEIINETVQSFRPVSTARPAPIRTKTVTKLYPQ